MFGATTAAIGNNAICYEAINRVLRNSVVDYLRTRMAAVFPTEHLERLKKPFTPAEWTTLVAQANACRTSGGTETQIQDDYDLLSVGHFFNIFDSYFDKLFSAAALAGGKYQKPVKAKLLGNLKTIKDGRDPLAHPVAEEISYEEAFGILTDAKQVLAALGLDTEATKITQLMRQLRGLEVVETQGKIWSLPTQDSIYVDFVGRQEVLGWNGIIAPKLLKTGVGAAWRQEKSSKIVC